MDALRYILQDEVVRVTASAVSDQESGDVEAAAMLSLQFARGTLASVLVSSRAEYRTPIEIVGEPGALRLTMPSMLSTRLTLSGVEAGESSTQKQVPNRYAYARQVDAFSDALEGKGAFPAPGEEGWQNQEILDAAYRSVKSGKTEEVPLVEKRA